MKPALNIEDNDVATPDNPLTNQPDLTTLLDRESRILSLKEQGRSCSEIQQELGIARSDKHAIKHLRETFFGKSIGSLPVWTPNHVPLKNSPENAMHMIKAMDYVIRFNLLKKVPFINGQPIKDIDLNLIQNEAKRWGLNSAAEHLDAVLKEMAMQNAYHPFYEWVESRTWDGNDRITALFETLQIQEDFKEHIALYETYIRRWFISIVAKQYKPGSRGFVLVLQGPQGKGKDSWFQKLVPLDGCYAEGEIDPANKDHKLIHGDTVLYNVAEIDATIRRKDVAALKQFLTLSQINERQPYGRYKEYFKSICSFCGSVNDPQFLNDPTGSRRYAVIPIAKIDYLHSVDIQQVFAQALHLFRSGEQYWFDDEETEQLNDVNEAFQGEDYLDGIAAEMEAGECEMTCTEILQAFGIEKPGRGETIRLGIILIKKGIKGRTKKKNGISLKHYYVTHPNVAGVEKILRNKKQ